MKNLLSPRLILLGTLVGCALVAPRFALAQPEAPVAADAPAPAPRKGGKPKGDKKPHGKMMTPRMVTATETATGKPLTPELKAQLTQAMHDRDAAVKAANDAYYVAFAQATGLTPEQAKEIDKPARIGAKPTTEPKAEVTTNMNELTDTDDAAKGAPVTPK